MYGVTGKSTQYRCSPDHLMPLTMLIQSLTISYITVDCVYILYAIPLQIVSINSDESACIKMAVETIIQGSLFVFNEQNTAFKKVRGWENHNKKGMVLCC